MIRKYKTGSIWAFWRWTEVDTGYITRLHFIKTPWFAIDFHWLHHPDPEPFLHDHPVSFLSIILWGGYDELRLGRVVRRSWFNYIRASLADSHTIMAVRPHTLTLCLMGPKVREWGFHTPHGWIYWRDYYAEKRAKS